MGWFEVKEREAAEDLLRLQKRVRGYHATARRTGVSVLSVIAHTHGVAIHEHEGIGGEEHPAFNGHLAMMRVPPTRMPERRTA
jgi:hypothetical protein